VGSTAADGSARVGRSTFGFAGPLGGVAGAAVGDAPVGAPGAGRVRPAGGTGAGRSTPVEAVSLRSSRGARIGRVMTPDRPRERVVQGTAEPSAAY
jgi:hypothetical protein